MTQGAQAYEQGTAVEPHNYSLAGWLAIAAGILFPVGFVFGIVSGIIGIRQFNYHGPVVGPADLIFFVQTAFVVYALYLFRRLLNERYEFRELNTLILMAIGLQVIFQVGGFILKLAVAAVWSETELAATVVLLGFVGLCSLTFGIVDILIASRLLRQSERFSDLIRWFAYLTMVGGVCEVTIVLVPVALLLVPVVCILLGLILLRANEEVEFV